MAKTDEYMELENLKKKLKQEPEVVQGPAIDDIDGDWLHKENESSKDN